MEKLKAGAPDVLLTALGGSTAGFFHAYETAGWKVPISGRVDFAAALGAVSPEFRAAGGLSGVSGIAVFTPLLDRPGVRSFVAAYQARYGLVPTQRSFFVYEATYLVVDAVRRAGTDTPAAIEQALKTTEMPSLLGGTYKMDDHNHPHMPLFILGLKDGKPGVIATE
jgi:ABC-type branched-subunit amino acid transport system substrate-binding protein